MSKSNQLVKLTFIYPNKDLVECTALVGQELHQVAIKNKIQMHDKYPSTCLVQIQGNPEGSGQFHEVALAEPTKEEVKNLTPFQIKDGFRFAHTYIVNEALSKALIFLNLVRIYYVDSSSKSHPLQAYTNENLLSLRERSQSSIDLAFSCHGALACSTCHCLCDVTDSIFKKLGEISEDEEDLLQFCNPQKHSRLGCRVAELSAEFDNLLHFRNPRAKNHV